MNKMFHGDFMKEKNKWRYDQIKKFKESNSQILIANPSVLGTGVNISFANTIIHYDRDFNYTINEQSDGRMERIGLNEEAEIYNLIVLNSLEIHLEKALENKKNIDDNFLSTGYLTQDKVKNIFNPK
jgi:SNF2 family DNA or RNA helicase